MKSKDKVMASLLRDDRVTEYDVLAIQEPWRNPFMNTTHNPTPQRFELTYQDSRKTRVCFFINKRIPSNRWTVKQHTPDLITLELKVGRNNEETIAIHNVYNPVLDIEPSNSAITTVQAALNEWRHIEQIVVGDVNLHHPYWGGEKVRNTDNETEELLRLVDEHQLALLYQPGTITYRRRDAETTIDLALATPYLQDILIRCRTREDLDHDSDHLPLETVLAVPSQDRTIPEKWNLERADREKLCRLLVQYLPLAGELRTGQDIDNTVQGIVTAILNAVRESTPKVRLSPRSIPGWTRECKEAQMLARRLRREYQRKRTPESWEAYRQARNGKARIIRRTLRDSHRTRIREATSSEEGLWTLARWARNRQPRSTCIPPLQRPDGQMETDATGKLELFRKTFFPPLPNVDLNDTRNYEYKAPLTFPPITQNEVATAIRRMPGKKAPGKDTIPSHLLHHISPYITRPLQRLYNACIKLHYCPRHFRESVTVTLRKPGRDDYGQLQSYRPVALLNTLGKVIESIIAKRISYAVEEYGLLPSQHMGGRRGISTEQAIHLLLERIHTTWKINPSQVASVLFLDVSGAFDHVSHERLVHNLRKRRIDRDTIGWIASFLSNRKTTIRMGDVETEAYDVHLGIPQGSPLSPILYLFYNADLLEVANNKNVRASGWIDDVYFFTRSTSTKENCQNLEQAHRMADEWARTHGSKFSPIKYQLIHFTRSKTKFDTKQSMRIRETEIRPTNTAVYLGILLDPGLKWESQINKVQKKATPHLAPLSMLAGSTWGSGLTQLRRIYQATVLPAILYGRSAWYTLKTDQAHHKTRLQILNRIQARAARIIAGAFRSTSMAALNIEIHLLPMKQLLERRLMESHLQIRTNKAIDLIETARKGDGIGRGHIRLGWRPWDWSPLEKIDEAFQQQVQHIGREDLERIHPFIAPPYWTPPEVTIEPNTKSATQRHNLITSRIPRPTAIYTDGSGIHGRVGASAVCPKLHEKRAVYMGEDSRATVYAAELQGILLALAIALYQKVERVVIFTDNQSALKSIRNPARTSGQYILEGIIHATNDIRDSRAKVEFHWIPSHSGIEGNEEADRAAKEATGWRQTRGRRNRLTETMTDATAPKPMYQKVLRSAARTQIRKVIAAQWEHEWSEHTTGRESHELTPTPTKKVLNVHTGLHKALSTVIVQMRTGKIGLRHYLYRRGVPEVADEKCGCGRGTQTIRHVLLACRHFSELREELFGRRSGGPDREGSMKTILNTPKLATRAAKFMLRTGLLGQFEAVNRDEIS